MNGGSIVREARRRAGITQLELARRLGTRQPVVTRWETGRRAPDFDTVTAALAACGFELGISLTPLDTSDDLAIAKALSLTPAERLQRNEELLHTEAWAQQARRAGG